MKSLRVPLLWLLALSVAHAQTTTISALPAGSALGGTEALPMDQTGCAVPATCKTTPDALDTFILGLGIPLSALPAQASSTVLGNYSGSSASPLALNPLAVANMMAAQISVDVVATTAITLSGAQTIDGISIGSGQTVPTVSAPPLVAR